MNQNNKKNPNLADRCTYENVIAVEALENRLFNLREDTNGL
jgi:hypothetical protein